MLTVAVVFATLAVVTAGAPAAKTWYGPVTVSFEVQFGGNPYDPDENDVKVVFTDETGARIERLAYFDGTGSWKATLVAERKGNYKAVLVRNGKPAEEPSMPRQVVLDTALPHGYVRRDTAASNRFVFDDGGRYYPLGHDLGWPSGGHSIPEQLAKMHENGVDWARIWAASWGDLNPWWPNDSDYVAGQLWPKALKNWEDVVEACDKNDVKFQFVLFHHGLFSSTVNPNWPDHPWNVAKGGFLKSASDFFTDPEARRRTKMWLRYAVARWAHSPSIMAWELFNEVEWVDAMQSNRDAVAAWHKEMATYLRQIDPYRHLVTTSSTMEFAKLWDDMDYYQPHTYPADIATSISGQELPADKPLFFGEFGPQDMTSNLSLAIRDGVYASMLSNHAGTAMFWSWDQMYAPGRYDEFKIAREVMTRSRIASHEAAKRIVPGIETPRLGEVAFRPGKGWGKTDRFQFDIPTDLTANAMNRVSSFLQSQTGGHKDLNPEPLAFSFVAKVAGTAELHIATLSRAGARIHLILDGTQVDEYEGPAGEGDRRVDVTLKAPYQPGQHDLKVSNDGADWVVFDRLKLAPFGPEVQIMALSESDWMLARVTGARAPLMFELSKLSLADGEYDLTEFDLDTGKIETSKVKVKDFKSSNHLCPGKDFVLLFVRS